MSSSSFPPDELKQIVQEVATLLKERKETISVAETVGSYQLQAQSHTNTLKRLQVV
jgi:nicotinamide mononucleotide (NMN) deamidase PncC